MSLIPEFQFGLLNGWLCIAPLVLSGYISMFVNKKAAKRATDMSWYDKKDKLLMVFCMFFYYGASIYSIVITLKIGTAWFYFGIAITIFSFIPLVISYLNYASTPLDEPVVKGIYKISRNPMYFFTSTGFIGVGIACASWLMLMIVVVYLIFQHIVILSEERYCLKKYGKAYEDLKNNVARYFLFF